MKSMAAVAREEKNLMGTLPHVDFIEASTRPHLEDELECRLFLQTFRCYSCLFEFICRSFSLVFSSSSSFRVFWVCSGPYDGEYEIRMESILEARKGWRQLENCKVDWD